VHSLYCPADLVLEHLTLRSTFLPIYYLYFPDDWLALITKLNIDQTIHFHSIRLRKIASKQAFCQSKVGRVGERGRRGGEETINNEVRAERVIRGNMVWEVIQLQYVTNFEPLYIIRQHRRVESVSVRRRKGVMISHVWSEQVIVNGNGKRGA